VTAASPLAVSDSRVSQYSDALDHIWTFDSPSRRIVALVPSTIETLFDFGLVDRLVACTDYNPQPAAAATWFEVSAIQLSMVYRNTANHAGLVGGGKVPRPLEVSRAHIRIVPYPSRGRQAAFSQDTLRIVSFSSYKYVL
jgi:hypothetical protein